MKEEEEEYNMVRNQQIFITIKSVMPTYVTNSKKFYIKNREKKKIYAKFYG